MVAGPEVCRMIEEFEVNANNESDLHHEQAKGRQTSFVKEVQDLLSVVSEMGNPFEENSEDLLTLDTKEIMEPDVAECMRHAYSKGKEQYEQFFKERFVDQSKTIQDPIKKNQLKLFSRKRVPVKSRGPVETLKEDCALFSRLYIACQSREGNLERFFMYENQPWPPSLALQDQMRSGSKADLLAQLEARLSPCTTPPETTALIMDGAMIVQMLSPGTATTFQEYFTLVFRPYIMHKLQAVERLDIVWDLYIADSLKTATRDKRGKGIRRRVASSSMIPSNWQSFLRNDENKTELFCFLSEHTVSIISQDKQIYSTLQNSVLCTSDTAEKNEIEPRSHEEADTRMVLQVSHAAANGHSKIMVRTGDTDVVVIVVSNLHKISAAEIWISFGVGKYHRYLAAHEIAISLGPQRARSASMFHALTGCDVTSFFCGRGKKSAWDTWQVFPDVTDALLSLSESPNELSNETMALIERFVVLWYNRTSNISKVNEARQHLFARKGRALESIPPTQAALRQHVLRAIYQGVHVWGNALYKNPTLPSPTEWGWQKTDYGYKPKWTTLGQAQQMCYELIHCSCKKACKGLCQCYRANLSCTSLCECGGKCYKE